VIIGRRPAPPGPSADELREQRLSHVKQLAERFVYDLGLLLAGNAASLEEYVAGSAARRLRACLEPFLAAGDVMRPNFGEYGELRIEGDLLATDRPLTADVEFTDQSVRERHDGDLVPTGSRRVRLTLQIDPDLQRITEFRLHRPAGP